MADNSTKVQKLEEDIDDPVPASELQELHEEKRILSSVYRHVEHQQVVEQVAGRAGVISEEAALSAGGSKSPSSPWMGSGAQKTSSLPLSAGGSEVSESAAGLHLRLSAGVGSTEAGDIGKVDSVQELLSLPQSLDSAVRLNMALQKRFRDRILALTDVLNKNIERQEILKEEIKCAKAMRESDHKSDGSGKLTLRISHFCVPYFKNRSGMPAPMNEDAKMKVEKGYTDLYITRPRTWLTVERESLDLVVREEWKTQKLSSTNLTVRELECRLQKLNPEDQDAVDILDVLVELKQTIKDLEGKAPVDVIPDRGEKQLDWDRIAARAFDGHRTPDECRLQWENYLHPDIEKKAFTENEDLLIQRSVMCSRFKVPDWEKIARDLRTKRTAYQVMQRYVSFIEPTLKPCKWSKKDSDKLLHTVNMLRVGNHIPWAQVHQHFVGYSRVQLQSRWRMIDPDISKGPFTVEEDFILIKGLHMFGLNFESIIHFMPGRTYPQVKDRYKRTIFPSLSTKPWTMEEDALLIEECSVGAKNWRKMIMKLPRFNACQIRMRYHTIQVWQTLSNTNLIPPPLFPITSTVKPETIQEIRKAMIMDLPELKTIVDESRKGINLKNVLKELEERRMLIRERKSEKNMRKMKKVTEKRGHQPGLPNPHHRSVPDIFLTEFFMPFRPCHVFPNLSFPSVQNSLLKLSTALQLKITKELTEEDVISNLLQPEDASILQKLKKSHVLEGDAVCARNCPACLPVFPERIPLLPPCKTTVGAFKSILVHRPKLRDMAQREFFLYKYSRSELHNLQSSYKGRRFYSKRSNYTLTQKDPLSEAEGNQDEAEGSVLMEANDNSTGQGTVGQKIHITYQVQNEDQSRSARRSTALTPLGSLKAYSKGRGIKGEPVDAACMSNLQGDTSSDIQVKSELHVTPSGPNIKLEINGQDVTVENANFSSRPLTAEEVAARETSESLLFQRMLSMLFWPALMTFSGPTTNLMTKIQEKINSGEVKKPPKPVKVKNILDKDDLDIETQAKYISYLAEESKKEAANRYKKRTSKEKKAAKAEHTDENHGNNIEGDSAENDSQNKTYDGRRDNNFLATHHRKRRLKSLRRSLVMKKVWDARRKGSCPQRTSDRDKRNYTPRGSRTRDCVRKDMIRPPKEEKIWDFPLDGPMRVQPQVPAIPSEQMLLSDFSESSNNPNELDNSLESSPKHTVTNETKVVKRRGRKPGVEKPQEEMVHEQQVESFLPSFVCMNAKSSSQRKCQLKYGNTVVDVHPSMTDKGDLSSEDLPSYPSTSKGGTRKRSFQVSSCNDLETQTNSKVEECDGSTLTSGSTEFIDVNIGDIQVPVKKLKGLSAIPSQDLSHSVFDEDIKEDSD